jgi:hypothetical protein
MDLTRHEGLHSLPATERLHGVVGFFRLHLRAILDDAERRRQGILSTVPAVMPATWPQVTSAHGQQAGAHARKGGACDE